MSTQPNTDHLRDMDPNEIADLRRLLAKLATLRPAAKHTRPKGTP